MFWTLPKQAATLVIDVKPPLRAHLLTWSDVHFNGNTAVALDQGNPLEELIYASGTLEATVDNHNPASQHEIIKVIVEPPGGQSTEIPLHAGQEITADGDVEVDVAGLDYDFDADDGSNGLSLSAWKPINEVVDGGPDVVSVTLKAVPPKSLEILEPADGITVKRTQIPHVRCRYARAAFAAIGDRLGADLWNNFGNSTQTYDLTTRDLGPYTLVSEPGDHELTLTAYNDFAPGNVFTSITIHAPAPTITVDLQPDDPDKFMAPNKVGHSVTKVPALITATNALTVEIWQGGTRLTTFIMAEGSETVLTAQNTLPTLPPQGHLQAGDNTFELRAINDFAITSTQVTINRRAKIFEAHGDPNMSFEARPAPGHDGETVYVGVTVHFADSVFDDVEQWIVTVPFPSSADNAFLDFLHYDFTTSIRPDGTVASVESVDTLVVERIGVLMTGPDFQSISLLLMPDPSWVVDDPDTVQEPVAGLFTSVVTDPAIRGSQDMTVVAIDTLTLQRLNSDGNP